MRLSVVPVIDAVVTAIVAEVDVLPETELCIANNCLTHEETGEMLTS